MRQRGIVGGHRRQIILSAPGVKRIPRPPGDPSVLPQRSAPVPGRSNPRRSVSTEMTRRLPPSDITVPEPCTLDGSSIPRGLSPPAQGCEGRATLGNRAKENQPCKGCGAVSLYAGMKGWHNPVRVDITRPRQTQGSSSLATLGFVAESLRDSLSATSAGDAFKAQRGRQDGRAGRIGSAPVVGHCCARERAHSETGADWPRQVACIILITIAV